MILPWLESSLYLIFVLWSYLILDCNLCKWGSYDLCNNYIVVIKQKLWWGYGSSMHRMTPYKEIKLFISFGILSGYNDNCLCLGSSFICYNHSYECIWKNLHRVLIIVEFFMVSFFPSRFWYQINMALHINFLIFCIVSFPCFKELVLPFLSFVGNHLLWEAFTWKSF